MKLLKGFGKNYFTLSSKENLEEENKRFRKELIQVKQEREILQALKRSAINH